MSFLSSIVKGVGAGMLTGSFAGGFTAAASNSFWAGMGVGVADNFTFGSISNAMTGAWNGNYGYGGFYGGRSLDYFGAGMYNNYGNYFGNNYNWFDTNLNW